MSFHPSDISGLTVWVDATDISTLYQDNAKTIPVTADGQPVAVIADKSGNGYDFKNESPRVAEAVNRPTFKADNGDGRSFLDFDKSAVASGAGENGQWLYSDQTLNAKTFAFVYKKRSNGTFMGLSDSANSYVHHVAGKTYWSSGGYSNIASYSEPTNVWHVIIGDLRNTVQLDGVDHDFASKTDQSHSGTTWLGRRPLDGNGYPLDGEFMAMLAYDARLTGTEISDLLSFLTTKYIDPPASGANIIASITEQGDTVVAGISAPTSIAASITEQGDTVAAIFQTPIGISGNTFEQGDTTSAAISLAASLSAENNEDGDTTAAIIQFPVRITASLNEEGDTTTANVSVPRSITAAIIEAGDTTVALITVSEAPPALPDIGEPKVKSLTAKYIAASETENYDILNKTERYKITKVAS